MEWVVRIALSAGAGRIKGTSVAGVKTAVGQGMTVSQ